MPKKIKRKRQTAGEKSILSNFFDSLLAIINRSAVNLLILLVTFIIVSFATLIDFATRELDQNNMYADYEIGQVADKTILADRTIIPATADGLTIMAGEKVIRKGFVISEIDYNKLQLLALSPSKLDYRGFWHSVLYLFLLLLTVLLLLTSIKRITRQRNAIFLSILFIFVYCIAALAVKIPLFSSPYALVAVIPASLCIMLISILINLQTANCFSLLFALGVFGASSFGIVPFLYVLITCLFSARLVYKMEKRIDFIHVSMLLFLVHVGVLGILFLIFQEKSVNVLACLAGVGFNGFISGILTLGFLTPMESVLNTVTMFRLMDLSDLNSPIMKRMLLGAPGTYSHSMMVATLAESACREINANPLLARVGAYYHDLGKLEQPEYFVENQTLGNKHDEINPRLSASVIRRHVRKGVEKAYQLHLPQEVIDIISEHHGNGLISYFYNEAKKQDENVSPDEFCYIGTPPSSKESAVVMLADTVEAACRTLEKPSVPRLEKFIHQLVMQKYEDRQLDKSNLTFSELDTIQEVFVNTLAGYYHSRIEYPNQKDPDLLESSEKQEKNEKPEEKEEN